MSFGKQMPKANIIMNANKIQRPEKVSDKPQIKYENMTTKKEN